MLSFILKFYVIYTCCLFICEKSKLFNTTCWPFKFAQPLFPLGLSTISYFMDLYIPHMRDLIALTIIFIYIALLSSKPQFSFVTTVLAFTISYSLHFSLGLITTIMISPFYYLSSSSPYFAITVITAILQLIITTALMNIKRFKKGIPLFSSNIFTNISTIICLIFLSSLYLIKLNISNPSVQLFALIAFILIYAFLIYWWQAQITKAYRRRLELRELESLRTEVTELTLAVARLVEENEKLARITHRDNTLITTLKNSTIKYLSTDFKNPAEAFATRDKLISNINALSTERMTLSTNSCEMQARYFDTGLPLLDELLGHMDEKATQNNISFSVHFAIVLTDFVPKDISENDLVHTIDDLLKNAFKATTTCEKRSVQLQFYKLGKHFVVEVADNGIPFEIKSLVNMGLEKITTYADGSGIGLVDIWTTKEKYGATYHLDEYTSHPSFTKKISLTFDKKNLYSIRTWRKDEILQISKRTDLQVYDYSE